MTCHIKGLLFISLFALGVFVSNAAQAQTCTQVLYIFRHAEDVDTTKPPPGQSAGLTAVGKRHAQLYPDLIRQLRATVLQGTTAPPCVLGRVFAMWNRPNTITGVGGTTNPYFTALPLAQAQDPMVVIPPPPPYDLCPVASGQHPATYVPEMCFKDDIDNLTYYLCEYPGDANCSADFNHLNPNNRNAYKAYTDTGDIDSHFYMYLHRYFQSNPNTSAAIFHTSDGMPAVSYAFGERPHVVLCPYPNDGNTTCYEKTPPFTDDWLVGSCELPIDMPTSSCYKEANVYRLLMWPGTQRSSINIFQHQSSTTFAYKLIYVPITTSFTINQNLLMNLAYSQCYNLNNSTQLISASGSYYCQYSGSLANGLDNANSATTLTVGKPPSGAPPPTNCWHPRKSL
jgi:hypothetical protein